MTASTSADNHQLMTGWRGKPKGREESEFQKCLMSAIGKSDGRGTDGSSREAGSGIRQ